MSAITATLRGRAAAERNMPDRWVVERSTTGGLNEATGEYENTIVRVYPPPDSPDADGSGKFTAANTAVNDVDAAGQLLVESSAVLALPVGASAGVTEGDMARCVAAVLDPSLVGVTVRVEGPHRQTFATMRRFRVKEVT